MRSFINTAFDSSLMKVRLNGADIMLCKKATVNDLLQHVCVNRETVVVSVNGEITIEEAELSDGDEVRLISTVSGG